MALGRPAGAVIEKLPSLTISDGSTAPVKRFTVIGARSVAIQWKADSGTPTITIGAYVHPNATRDTTVADYGLKKVTLGSTVAAGQVTYIYIDTTLVATPASELVFGVQELDIQVAGNVTNLDVRTVVLY